MPDKNTICDQCSTKFYKKPYQKNKTGLNFKDSKSSVVGLVMVNGKLYLKHTRKYRGMTERIMVIDC